MLDPKKFDAIVEAIANGVPTYKAIKSQHVGEPTFYAALNADEALQQRYARAKTSAIEALADETIKIADSKGDHNDRRLRVDTRKWLLAKLAPKKYGDHVEIEHRGSIDLLGELGRREAKT